MAILSLTPAWLSIKFSETELNICAESLCDMKMYCSQVLLKDTEDSKKTLEEELQKTAEVKPAASQLNTWLV